MPQKPLASLSLDLDNKWSYIKTHGDPGWESFPSYLDVVVPRVLDILRKRDLTITFFIVGQDAAIETNQPVLKSIADAGHEIGNHSFHHEPWLHLYSEEDIAKELATAEEAIIAATDVKPVGFRGPGFSVSEGVLKVLVDRGYRYDCSTFPTYLGPLARAYYFMTAKLTPEEKESRKKLFGTLADGLRPNKPYRWNVGGSTLLEVPVTTMPVIKIPIHASYILYLAKFSPFVAKLYLRMALLFCRVMGVEPSFLLHPLDFMTEQDAPELSFFPAMRVPLDKKLALMDDILTMLTSQFEVLSMSGFVQRAESRSGLRSLQPNFGPQQSV